MRTHRLSNRLPDEQEIVRRRRLGQRCDHEGDGQPERHRSGHEHKADPRNRERSHFSSLRGRGKIHLQVAVCKALDQPTVRSVRQETPEKVIRDVGRRIAELRRARAWTQDQLAERMEVSVQFDGSRVGART